jgi:hypothetical protein
MAETNDEGDKDKDYEAELNLFFIGNSYFCSNNLPDLTQQALQGLEIKAGIKSHNPPGETFNGHLENLQGDGHKATNHVLYRFLWNDKQLKSWDWVLLQNQSQLPGFIHDVPKMYNDTVDDVQRLTTAIRVQHGTVNFLFVMTWGRRNFDKGNPVVYPNYLTMQSKITDGYLHYVKATSTPDRPSFVAPVGLVFQTIYNEILAKREDPAKAGSLFHELYHRDGSHPSLAGSYVCAMTIVATLVEVDANDLQWTPPQMDPDLARQLRAAVSSTIQETVANGTVTYPWQQ